MGISSHVGKALLVAIPAQKLRVRKGTRKAQKVESKKTANPPRQRGHNPEMGKARKARAKTRARQARKAVSKAKVVAKIRQKTAAEARTQNGKSANFLVLGFRWHAE